MGFRLPLDGLPWVAPGDATKTYERDPFAPREALSAPRDAPRERAVPRFMPAGQDGRPYDAATEGKVDRKAEAPPARFESASGVARTAGCVGPRDGVLHVFMPPVDLVEDYLDLCAAVEATATSLGKKVRLEGYHPPSHSRVR